MAKSKRAAGLQATAMEQALSLCDAEVRLLRSIIDTALAEAEQTKDPKRALENVKRILKAYKE